MTGDNISVKHIYFCISMYSLSYRSSAAPVCEAVYEEMWQINLFKYFLL